MPKAKTADSPSPAKLQEDRHFLASIIGSSDDAIISKSLDGTILTWNAAAEKLFGYRQDQMVGQSITKIIPSDRLAEEQSIIRRLGRGERIDHYETSRIRKDGRPIEVSISISPIRNSKGRIIGACKIARDITERRAAEDALRRSEQIMRAILDAAADAIITIDQHGIIQSTNAATQRLFGYPAAELIGQNVNRLMPEPFHSQHDGYIRHYCRTGKPRIIGIGREVTGRRKDGTTFPMHLAVSEARLKDRRLFTGIVHDLTGRRQLERQIMEAAANEQRRIGQDLHDGLCQDLIGIAFGIDAVARNQAGNGDGESLEKLAANVRDAAGQARQLAHGLNPVDLNAGGLAAALENLTTKVAESFHIRCNFRWDRTALVHDDATATHLYRIAQEAVSNAIRHGKASNIQVSLAEHGAALVLSVTDNGKGMPQAMADSVRKGLVVNGPNQQLPAGMGLQTMQYRTRVIGGTFMVSPRKGGGTIVTCTIGRQVSPRHAGTKSDKASGNVPHPKRRPTR